jgi:hypothetical protein
MRAGSSFHFIKRYGVIVLADFPSAKQRRPLINNLEIREKLGGINSRRDSVEALLWVAFG